MGEFPMKMPNCREVAAAVSQGGLEQAPWHKKIFMRLHLWRCSLCSGYARQIRFLGEAFRRKWGGRQDLSALKKKLVDRLSKPED